MDWVYLFAIIRFVKRKKYVFKLLRNYTDETGTLFKC
jgi:hypothetical protein